MQEVIESHIQTEDEKDSRHEKYNTLSLKIQRDEKDFRDRQRYLEPPINIQSRHYSLEPDCIGGWKPKNTSKPKPKPKHQNVFPLRYDEEIVDQVVKQLIKNKNRYNQAVVYLGPRKINSFLLHQNREYLNPYRFERIFSPNEQSRNGIYQLHDLRTSFLTFNSNFQSGNLDAVIQRSSQQFDLFMRVDTNTRGHTNWYYFEVRNNVFIGTVTFNICNFRRPVSLYQRGLKPYVWSKEKNEGKWIQQGQDIKYEKQRLRYKFLYNNNQQIINPMLNTFYALSFNFKFQIPHDVVKFAYCPPYTYSQLNEFLKRLENYKKLSPFKSLSGLTISVIKITNQEIDESNKKIVLVTGRIHPGQSNSSYVAQGFLEFVCSPDSIAKQLRNNYIFYVVPMLNPDGVVAGNYRTSLFGKDLNRTFDQSRKYAFPEIFYLLKFAEDLKKTYKKRFCLYLDLHGHSVKKNVFMYGPDYSLQDSNYEISRQLPKILGNMTNYFRYYSCSFRISDSKTSTGRAVFNRVFKIPYTYTMQSSNGCYFDFTTHTEIPFTTDKWKEMGVYLAKSLNVLKLQKLPKIARTYTLKITKKMYFIEDRPNQPISDDEINEDDSDREPDIEDLPDQFLNKIQMAVKGVNEEDQKEKNNSIHLRQQFPSSDKNKKKKPKLQQLTKRQTKNQSSDNKPEIKQSSCSYQIPQRKNISFPQVFPVHRAEIFMNRHSRHEKYETPLQLRFRKNESQPNKKVQLNSKNSISTNKIIIIENQQEVSQEYPHKKDLNFNDLIKKYKFNF